MIAALNERVEQHLLRHKRKYILQGVGFIVTGILSATLSSATALHTELLIGVALLATGVFQLVLTLKSQMHWWSLLSACLSIVAGAVIVWKPFPVLIAVVTLLVVFLMLEGMCELFLASRFRPARSRGWMTFSGIVTLVMAAVLWIGYPTFDVLYLNWIVAINFVLYGLSLLMLVWRTAEKRRIATWHPESSATAKKRSRTLTRKTTSVISSWKRAQSGCSGFGRNPGWGAAGKSVRVTPIRSWTCI